MSVHKRRAQVLGDRLEGRDKNYGSEEGVTLNPRSAAGFTPEEVAANTASPEAQKVLRQFYDHPSSQPKRR